MSIGKPRKFFAICILEKALFTPTSVKSRQKSCPGCWGQGGNSSTRFIFYHTETKHILMKNIFLGLCIITCIFPMLIYWIIWLAVQVTWSFTAGSILFSPNPKCPKLCSYPFRKKWFRTSVSSKVSKCSGS